MSKFDSIGLALLALSGVAVTGSACAADTEPVRYLKPPVDCRAPDSPYKKYDCLDQYLGDGFFERLVNYYRLEWGHEGPPADPKAPPSRRAGWPDAPQTAPPMPFTEWPYGGATNLGVTRPNAVDSPLMVALGNTELGKAMSDAHIQAYGWVNGGGNISTNKVTPGGNWPASYDYTPNTVQLDQAVVYVERLPDTVQTDHIDWGFRFSAIYGENYRYTTAFGVASYQLLGHNLTNGFDLPMMYGEVYIPQVAEGPAHPDGPLHLAAGYRSAARAQQLYVHALVHLHLRQLHQPRHPKHARARTRTGSFNWASSLGTDTAPWHWGQKVANPFPNPVFPDTTMLRDPGAKPSVTAGVRWQSDSG